MPGMGLSRQRVKPDLVKATFCVTAGARVGGVIAPAGPRNCVGRTCFLRATPSDIAGFHAESTQLQKGNPRMPRTTCIKEANPGFYTAAKGSQSEIEVDGE
jgi:hypothetical protein